MWIGKIFNELFLILFRSGLGFLNILNVLCWLIPNRSRQKLVNLDKKWLKVNQK